MKIVITREQEYRLILEAKQVGTLYHFTTLSGILGILSDNKLRASFTINQNKAILNQTRDFEHRKTISFSRDKNFYISPNYRKYAIIPLPIILTLDGDAISNHYKIKPFADLAYSNKSINMSQSEERVFDVDIDNISNYVIGIEIVLDSVFKILASASKSERSTYDILNNMSRLFEIAKNRINIGFVDNGKPLSNKDVISRFKSFDSEHNMNISEVIRSWF